MVVFNFFFTPLYNRISYVPRFLYVESLCPYLRISKYIFFTSWLVQIKQKIHLSKIHLFQILGFWGLGCGRRRGHANLVLISENDNNFYWIQFKQVRIWLDIFDVVFTNIDWRTFQYKNHTVIKSEISSIYQKKIFSLLRQESVSGEFGLIWRPELG